MKKQFFSLALFAAAWFAGGTAWAQSTPSQDDDGYYLLGSVEDVEWFSQQVADGHSTIKGKLTDDIDFNNTKNAHKPIGTYGKKFIGKFDGQNHRIKNMVLNDPPLSNASNDGTGFFGCVRVGGDGFIMGSDTEKETNSLVEIKNLIIDSSCSVTSSRQGTAGLVGRISEVTSGNTVLIENCVNEATINTTAQATAGIVGQINNANGGNVNIKKCINNGTVETTGLAAAGIISQVNNCTVTLTIESCMNLAEVKSTGNKNCGGIHGANTSSKGTIKILYCGNTGNVTGTDESAALTGWIGSNSGNVITACWNSGTVTGIKNSDNTYRGTVTATTIYDKNGGQGTTFTDSDVTSGKLCYLLNGSQSTNVNWYQKLNEDVRPMPIAKEGAIVYQNATYLCPDLTDGGVEYSNVNSSTIPSHDYVNGICSVCNGNQEPALVDGWYELTNVGNVEWFSAKVASGSLDINGKLMNDIDFDNVVNAHSPIGPSTGQKYNGTFDGQGFRIKNMIINRPTVDNQGFFGYLRGNIQNTYVKNLIIDSSCSITGNKYVGGIAANAQNNETYIYIQNCVNEADITALGGDAGGIIGSSTSYYPRWIIQNCVNTGTITATSDRPYAGGLGGWLGDNSNSRIENFVNTGTITYMDNNLNIYRGTITSTSLLVDVSGTTGATQGIVEGLSSSDLSTGKLTYYLNNQIGSNVFFQNLTGANVDAYPVPISTGHAVVYILAELGCDGNPVPGGTATYSNDDSGATIPDHTLGSNGFCTVCGRNPVTSLSQDVDGYLLVSNAAELEFLSSVVNSAGGTAKKVKLTADIDMNGVTHTPIGVDDGNKFCGEFDGQGYRILNMKLFSQNIRVGLFGGLRASDNTTIKNVIIDKSCKITGNRQIGAIAGACQTAISPLYLINCINEADVEGTGWNIAGMIGECLTDNMEIHITNCGNSGSIKADDANSCAIFGWARPGNVTVTNFWNTGEIIKGANDHLERDGHTEGQAVAFNFYNAHQDVMNADNVVLTNCYDASASASRSQGTILDASAATSGELTYKLGGDWCQTIGTDTHPVLDSSKPNVYEISVSDAGYASFVPTVNIASLPTGVTAYVGQINGSSLHLEAVTALPADNAFVVNAAEGNYYYNNTSETITLSETNDLQVATSAFNPTTENTIYCLAKKNGNVGFYPVATTVTIPARKVYLEITSGTSPVKGFFGFDEDDATGISLMEDGRSQMEDGAIYNIAGQRISKMQKGINIVNGKKVLK